MKCNPRDLLLYAVTDRHWLNGRSLKDVVKESLEGGVSMLQLREKELDYEQFLEEARTLQALCREYSVPFIINDNVELAIEIGADGVHVGQSDMEAGSVRERLGADRLLGVSAQTVEQAILAEKAGADYLGVGAVFATGSKADADDVSLETLKAICAAVSIPVVAIGGISYDNMDQLAGTGICGIAVISAIYAQKNITAAGIQLREKCEELFPSPSITINGHEIKGAIFDMDGVILNSMGFWRELPYRYLESKGIEPQPELINIIYSMSLEQGIHYIVEKYKLDLNEMQVLKEMSDIMLEIYSTKVEAKAGAAQLLSSLKAAGIPTIIATSSPREHITRALKRNGLWDYFVDLFTNTESRDSKHNPEIYLRAAEKLGVKPENALVFEDSHYALVTAKKAGFVTIGVFDPIGAHQKADLKRDADVYYENLEDFEIK